MIRFVLYRYTLAYSPPFALREGLLLHLIEKEREGWGEIAPLQGRSKETLLQAKEQLLSVLNSMQQGKKWDLPLYPCVAFGIACAKTDYRKKQIPTHTLCALLAGSIDQIRSLAKNAYMQGYRFAKLKITGLHLKQICDLIEELSPYFSLRLDANRSLCFSKAVELAQWCRKYRVEYIEEPIFELESLENFPYPFALDESLLELSCLPNSAYFTTLIFKPSLLYGYTLPQDKRWILSSACETGVGILGIAALGSESALGIDTYRFLVEDILEPPLDLSSGVLTFPKSFTINRQLLQEVARG